MKQIKGLLVFVPFVLASCGGCGLFAQNLKGDEPKAQVIAPSEEPHEQEAGE